jgi:hypothetical protein
VGRLWSVFHQKRYETHARRRYNAKPVMRIPVTNLILSSVKKDLDFPDPFTDLVLFLPASSFSLFITAFNFENSLLKMIISGLNPQISFPTTQHPAL